MIWWTGLAPWEFESPFPGSLGDEVAPGQMDLNKELFRGGLLFKAHRLLYHSTLGLRVIKKKKNKEVTISVCPQRLRRPGRVRRQHRHWLAILGSVFITTHPGSVLAIFCTGERGLM